MARVRTDRTAARTLREGSLHTIGVGEVLMCPQLVTDRMGIIYEANDAARRLLGATIVGRQVFSFVERDSVDAVRRVVSTINQGTATNLDVRMSTGRPPCWSMDLEIRRAENPHRIRWRIRRKSAESGEFRTSASAHRRPSDRPAPAHSSFPLTEPGADDSPESDLRIALGLVALLRARDISEVSRALALDLIEEHVVRQSAMLHGLWDASRLAVGALALQCRPLSLGELVSACTDALKPAATAAEVSLRSRVDAQVVVSGDERWLMHVVMNLLSNALKFTAPRGAIDVDVGVTGQRANLRIADTGRGIAKATLERIFDGPWDIHEANRAPHEKAGLGLFLVRKLVTLHGGEIHAQSDGIGHGSTFRLCLPLSSVDVGL